jgi:hypothetical protein
MNLVTSARIAEPKMSVSPPFWALMLFWVISVGVLVVLSQLAIASAVVKYALVGGYLAAMLGIWRKQLKGNYLVTLQANTAGLYFQTDDTNQYLHIPWPNVGLIEKAIFPLNRRGLRVEITGDLAGPVRHSRDVGNVRVENGRTYIYTIPQMRDRDRLIEQFESFRKGTAT